MFGGKNKLFKSLMMSAPDANTPAQQLQEAHATASATTTADNITTPEADTGKKADETGATAEKPRAAPQANVPSVPSIRVSSMDVERESQKVRSLYESGDDLNWEDGGRVSFAERLEPTVEVPSEEEENGVYGFP
jgi:hypothetical protein